MTTLFDAIERADAGTVWKLTQEGARLDEIQPETELTPLALAATSGQAEIVRTLLEVGADPNLGGATTPLEAAVVEGHREVVQALLAAGVDVDRRVADGFTPLMTAAATGDIELVRALLAAGARTRLANDAGETAMALAKAGGHSAVIDAIRSEVRRRREEAAAAEAGSTEAGSAQSETAAEPAADRGRSEGEAAAGGTVADDDGTPVPGSEPQASGATDPGDARVREESARGASLPEESAPRGSVPEESARDESAQDESAQDESAQDESAQDESARDESAQDGGDSDERSRDVDERSPSPDADDAGPDEGEPSGRDEAVAAPVVEVPAELLEAGGASAVALAREIPALAEAVLRLAERLQSDEEDAEESLASGGLDVHARDAEGRTLLMAAAYYGDPESVRALLRAGAEPDACDATATGHTPLVYAVRSLSPARLEVISDLHALGADVNRPCGRNQRTPLMHAAEADVYLEREGERGFALTTRHLIRLGADLEARDRHGNTVWRLIKRASLGAPTFSSYRRRLHQMLRALENLGARPVASHRV